MLKFRASYTIIYRHCGTSQKMKKKMKKKRSPGQQGSLAVPPNLTSESGDICFFSVVVTTMWPVLQKVATSAPIFCCDNEVGGVTLKNNL